MSYHERRLPHIYPTGATFFLTWRLFGSIPKCAVIKPDPDPGKAFAQEDREYDRSTEGPLWLKDERVARVVAEALIKGDQEYKAYDLYAWVIMANHVHAVLRPSRPLPELMRWLKGSTARAANLILNRTGNPFWQYETYDRMIRTTEELSRVIRYVERNPVHAGLAKAIEDYPWSSAGKSTAQA